MSFLLEVVRLCKYYGDIKAVDDISFGIPEGYCFGMLGPNGAGKTTTIEVIENILPATSGEILFRGQARNKSFADQIGIQFQSTALQDFLTVREVLDVFAHLYRHTLPLEQLVDACQLQEFLSQQANSLSGGQRQRLLLALALINDPQVVFLDEPTTGLDPQARRNFWTLINDIKKQGKTVILTTHYMDEAESLCDDLIIIDHGKIIDQGSPRALLEKHLPYKHVIIDKPPIAFDVKQFSGLLQSGLLEERDDQLEIQTFSVEQTLQELILAQADLSSLRVRNPSLEDLFIKLTGHQLRE